MLRNSSTAILLFSHTSKAEATRKTFNPNLGNKGNESIAKELIEQSLAVSKNTDLPVFTCYTHNQKGRSFGERFANAIESVYEKGYENVITIGNDCPTLTTPLLLEAHAKLSKEKVVIGPTNKGGVYLIAINKENYNRNKFIALRWESKHLQNDLKKYISKAALSVDLLGTHTDINTASDFSYVLHKPSFANLLRKLFITIITAFKAHHLFIEDKLNARICAVNLPLRAPPTL